MHIHPSTSKRRLKLALHAFPISDQDVFHASSNKSVYRVNKSAACSPGACRILRVFIAVRKKTVTRSIRSCLFQEGTPRRARSTTNALRFRSFNAARRTTCFPRARYLRRCSFPFKLHRAGREHRPRCFDFPLGYVRSHPSLGTVGNEKSRRCRRTNARLKVAERTTCSLRDATASCTSVSKSARAPRLPDYILELSAPPGRRLVFSGAWCSRQGRVFPGGRPLDGAEHELREGEPRRYKDRQNHVGSYDGLKLGRDGAPSSARSPRHHASLPRPTGYGRVPSHWVPPKAATPPKPASTKPSAPAATPSRAGKKKRRR